MEENKIDNKTIGKESLRVLMARKRQELQQSENINEEVFDPYANSVASQSLIRGRTGLVYDPFCSKHKCEWDEHYPECPERLNSVIDRCGELEERCKKITPNRTDIFERIITKHTRELCEKLEKISGFPIQEQEAEATKYDAVYFNQFTYEAACKSLNCVLTLVENVAKGHLHNGMSFSRPPGHHAMNNEFCGYCYFNNVAIAAEMCLQENLAKKIMIIDYDVHHGQGTQQMFYDRDDVLYFSIHRYEFGTFWPNLLESNFNFIGSGKGFGYNINVPLNDTGLKDDDYLAIVFNILLPVAYEFNPDLIIISAGYDAAIGCPEGRMCITPGFYAHLITLLSGLAKGKIAVCLEGGYFIPSLAEGCFMTLKALLGDPCPFLDPIRNVNFTVIETILNVRNVLAEKWNCFAFCSTSDNENAHKSIIKYHGETLKPPFETRNCYPIVGSNDVKYFSKIIQALKERYNTVSRPVCYVYDEIMLKHKPESGNERPERPQRLFSIFETLKQFKLHQRCLKLSTTIRDYTEFNVHDANYIRKLENLNFSESQDIYFNSSTNIAIATAVSGLLTVVDNVIQSTVSAGLAVIRPPGHHAEYDKALGFCFVNNIAIAANYILKKYSMERVLIIDFDVHHGNGTQNLFYGSKNVMYISVHRFDDGKFFPTNSDANYTNDGFGCGQGFNINIPLNRDKMGDSEYLAIFHTLILPIAYSFSPEIVLVSAGFDAGINDPLGCYTVSPEIFGHFIQLLKPLAEGKLILSLEGGYNVTTLSYSVAICVKALLGDPLLIPDGLYKNFSKSACKTLNNVSDHLKKYWQVLEVNKKLSLINYLCVCNKSCTIIVDNGRIGDIVYIENLLKTTKCH